MFEIGKTYQTFGGEPVEIIGKANEGTSYETVFGKDMIHRYNTRDFGRVTGTDSLEPDPRNLIAPTLRGIAGGPLPVDVTFYVEIFIDSRILDRLDEDQQDRFIELLHEEGASETCSYGEITVTFDHGDREAALGTVQSALDRLKNET